jgi:hypothetical protein
MIDQETDQESMTNMEGTTRARQLEAHGHITAFRPTTVTVMAETIATVHRQTKCPMWTGQINGKGAPWHDWKHAVFFAGLPRVENPGRPFWFPASK